MNVWLDKDCPRTNAIMGALVSGGDAMMIAEMLIEEVK